MGSKTHPANIYSLRGSISFTASATRPYCPDAFSTAVTASSPALMKSIILPKLMYL